MLKGSAHHCSTGLIFTIRGIAYQVFHSVPCFRWREGGQYLQRFIAKLVPSSDDPAQGEFEHYTYQSRFRSASFAKNASAFAESARRQ